MIRIQAILLLLFAALLPLRTVLAAAAPCEAAPAHPVHAPAVMTFGESRVAPAAGPVSHVHGSQSNDHSVLHDHSVVHDHGERARVDGLTIDRCADCLSACCLVPLFGGVPVLAEPVLAGAALPPPLLPRVERRPVARDRPPRRL